MATVLMTLRHEKNQKRQEQFCTPPSVVQVHCCPEGQRMAVAVEATSVKAITKATFRIENMIFSSLK